MDIVEIASDTHLIAQPTISSLRKLLNQMERDGWPMTQHIDIQPIANMRGAFVVRPVTTLNP